MLDSLAIHSLQIASNSYYMDDNAFYCSVCIHGVCCGYRMIHASQFHKTMLVTLFAFGCDFTQLLFEERFIKICAIAISMAFMSIHIIQPFYHLSFVAHHMMIATYIYAISIFIKNKALLS